MYDICETFTVGGTKKCMTFTVGEYAIVSVIC